MQKIADYTGRLLNHIETQYRPGERQLAIELVEALGCTIRDTSFAGDGVDTFLAAHPNADDLNGQNNAFYLSEISPAHRIIDEALEERVAGDPALRAMLDGYRALARSRPFGVPHFGIRYQSIEEVERAVEAVERLLSPRLGDRIHTRIYRPGDADAAGGETIQAFIHQDVIVSGSFVYGQLIELQKQA